MQWELTTKKVAYGLEPRQKIRATQPVVTPAATIAARKPVGYHATAVGALQQSICFGHISPTNRGL